MREGLETITCDDQGSASCIHAHPRAKEASRLRTGWIVPPLSRYEISILVYNYTQALDGPSLSVSEPRSVTKGSFERSCRDLQADTILPFQFKARHFRNCTCLLFKIECCFGQQCILSSFPNTAFLHVKTHFG
jgi:hypothetical protein